MLIGHHGAMYLFERYRLMWGEGRLGGGKTAFAFMLAYEMVKRGKARYIVSNVDSIWNDKKEDVVPLGQSLDTVVVLDEAGLMVKTEREALEIAAFLRKLNVYIVMPSKEPPARSMRALSFLRTRNFFSLGIPLWSYRVNVKSGSQRDIQQREVFQWLNPHKNIYGVYDTEAIPFDDGGISVWLQQHIERHKKEETHGTNIRTRRRSVQMVGEWGVSDQIAGLQEEVSELVALSDVEVPQRKNKK